MKTAWWVTFAVAASLHLALALFVSPRFEFDSAFYRTQAEALVAHGASLDASGQPETRYTPGYPAFLAVFLAAGTGYAGAMAAQHVIWILLACAAMWLVQRASGSTTAAVAAGLITALDLPGVQSSISVLSESLAALTITGAVCSTLLAIRAGTPAAAVRWAACAGALAGATALVRPIAIALGVPLALVIWFFADRSARLAACSVLLCVFAVLPVFWTVRNARVAGVPTLSSLAGINMLHFRAAGTLAIRDPGGIDANLIQRRDELERRACAQLEAKYQRPCADITWAERSGTYSSVALPVLLGDPVATAQQAARAFAMILFGGGATLLAELTGISEATARLVCLGYTVPLAALALLGIPYWWKRDRAFACLVVLTIGYMVGMALGAEAYSRFRVPVIALYAVLSGGGVALIHDGFVMRTRDALAVSVRSRDQRS